MGEPFSTTITAKDPFDTTVSNFTGTAFLSGSKNGAVTNTILSNVVYSSYSSGNYTLGHSFTPNTDLTVTHVRSCFGTKVSIWTDSGTLLASQTITSTPGTWTETPLSTPLVLHAGTTYRVGAFTAGGSYYWRNDGLSTFPNGTIVQSYSGTADVFPTTTSSARWWLVDLRYNADSSVPAPITPGVSSAFADGRWTGSITALAPITNLVLRAADGSGHAGASSPINVGLRNDISLSMTASPNLVSPGGNLTYTVVVTNIGPSNAKNVFLTNSLSPDVTFVSVNTSKGAWMTNANQVVCSLGLFNGNDSGTVQIIAKAISAGLVTNLASVTREETDAYTANNSVTSISTGSDARHLGE